MKMKSVILNGVLLSAVSLKAQIQPQQTQGEAQQPCATAPTPAPVRKPNWFERKARAELCKHNKNLCDLPSGSDIPGNEPKATKPCATPTPVTPIAPAPAPAAGATTPTANNAATPSTPITLVPNANPVPAQQH
jgi:hypothetical protein